MNNSMYLYIFVYGILIWFLYSRLAPVKGLKHLAAADFQKRMRESENPIVIDVRQPYEFQTGHIPDAVNIPLSQLKSHLNNISKDREILLYCRSGMRSRQAARILGKNGYKHLSHLQGGIMSWDGKTVK